MSPIGTSRRLEQAIDIFPFIRLRNPYDRDSFLPGPDYTGQIASLGHVRSRRSNTMAAINQRMMTMCLSDEHTNLYQIYLMTHTMAINHDPISMAQMVYDDPSISLRFDPEHFIYVGGAFHVAVDTVLGQPDPYNRQREELIVTANLKTASLAWLATWPNVQVSYIAEIITYIGVICIVPRLQKNVMLVGSVRWQVEPLTAVSSAITFSASSNSHHFGGSGWKLLKEATCPYP